MVLASKACWEVRPGGAKKYNFYQSLSVMVYDADHKEILFVSLEMRQKPEDQYDHVKLQRGYVESQSPVNTQKVVSRNSQTKSTKTKGKSQRS